MRTFSVLLGGAIAVSSGAVAAVMQRMTKFPVRVNGFSDFCDSYSLDQKGEELQVSGECSPDPFGARRMGAALFTSHININECLSNNNGDLVTKAQLVFPKPHPPSQPQQDLYGKILLMRENGSLIMLST